MNRFVVEVFKQDFTLFKTSPIYIINDIQEDRLLGPSFTTFEMAEFLCNWLNQVEEEVQDLNKLGS